MVVYHKPFMQTELYEYECKNMTVVFVDCRHSVMLRVLTDLGAKNESNVNATHFLISGIPTRCSCLLKARSCGEEASGHQGQKQQ